MKDKTEIHEKFYKSVHGNIDSNTLELLIDEVYNASSIKDRIVLLKEPRMPFELVSFVLRKIENQDTLLSVDSAITTLMYALVGAQNKPYHFLNNCSYRVIEKASYVSNPEWLVFKIKSLFDLFTYCKTFNNEFLKIDNKSLDFQNDRDVAKIFMLWNSSSEEIIDNMLKFSTKDIEKAEIALAEYCSLSNLWILSDHHDVLVRSCVAMRENLDEKILTKLSSDYEPLVRFMVASNANTPISVLKQLLEDPDERVSIEVLYNPSYPLNEIMESLDNANYSQRAMLAKNAQLDFSVLDNLAEDEDLMVRFNAINNKNYPELMKQLFIK